MRAFLIRTAGMGALFLMHWLLARRLSTDGYGTFTFTIGIATVTALLIPLGWPTVLNRYTARYVESAEWPLLRGLLARAHQTTSVLGVVAAVLLWSASRVFDVRPDVAVGLQFAALLAPCLALIQLRRHALQGLQRVAGMLIPDEVVLPAIVVSGVLLLGLRAPDPVLWLYVAAVLVAWATGSVWLLRAYPSAGRGADPSFRTREWMTVALPLLFTGVAQQVLTRTDVLILGSLADMREVGLYGAANRLAIMVPFFMLAVNAVVAPMLAAAYHGGRREEFLSVGRKSVLWSVAGALPLFLVLFVAPGWVLSMFGGEFRGAATLLRILAVGQLVNAATGPVGFMLVMSRHERVFAGIVGAAVVFNLAGHLHAVPRWEALGAAAVTAATVTVLNLGCAAAVVVLARTGRL